MTSPAIEPPAVTEGAPRPGRRSSGSAGEGAAAGHIAKVAARMFASQGYDATSVRMIVEAAGVTKPTLYYHFGSKEGLAQALFTNPMTKLASTLRGCVASGRSAVEILAEVLEAHFAFCREDADRARFVYALYFGPLSTGLAAELAGFSKDLLSSLTVAAETAGREGLIRPEAVEPFLSAYRGLIVIYTMDYLYRGRELDPGLAEKSVADLLRGFGSGSVARAEGELAG